MTDVVDLDGSYLEGGGQILRNALSLSCILCRPIRIKNIRANRPNPGLSNQHLFGLNLLQQITGATVKGNVMRSTEVEFHPVAIKSDTYFVDTHTAASITLVLQAALPVLAFGDKKSKLTLIGGTNVGMAPQVDFMTEVLRPNLEKFGFSFDFDMLKRGYYPKGGGRCEVEVPIVKQIKATDNTLFGKVEEINGWCFVAGNLPERLADDIKNAVVQDLSDLNLKLNIEAYKESANVARDNGSGAILSATTTAGCTIGADALGEKKVDAYVLGAKAAKDMKKCILKKICVDEHVQDQVILFMALAAGTSRIQTCLLTNHTLTAIHVCELMTGVKFDVKKITSDTVIISCEGIGFYNKNLI